MQLNRLHFIPKNRDIILEMNECDLLLKIQNHFNETHNNDCILQILTSKKPNCDDSCDCNECIQKWLNQKK